MKTPLVEDDSTCRNIAERKSAEDLLRESEERFRQIVTRAGEGIGLVDAEERFQFANPAAEAIFGVSPNGLVGRSLQEFLTPEDFLRVLRETGKRRGAEDSSYEIEILRPDGEKRQILVTAVPGATQEGQFKGTFGIFRDITERKRAEEERRVSEQRYRSLFEHMLDGFAYCKLLYDERDRPVDFVYLEVNHAFERLTGLRGVVGKRVSDVIPGIRESSPELFEIYSRVALTGEPESFEIDFKPLSRWLNVSVYSPGKGYFVAVFDDITEHKLNEADRETMLALLRLANASNNTRELIRTVAAEMQGWSGCGAVGIRLRDGDDFPYYETRGFPAEFVQAENYLCARDANRELLPGGQGNPVLECMCGNILCGRFDPRQPFFTPGGSFWTNRTGKLLASTEAGRQARTRNRCHDAGFESVALIPLRCSGRTLGLMQFNDPRPDRFTPEKIALMERAAASLAIAIEQRQTQAALRASEERYRLISENTADVIWLMDTASRRFTYVSPSVERLRGYSPEEVMAQPLEHALTPESYRLAVDSLQERLLAFEAGDESVRTLVHQLDQLRKDGSTVRTEVVSTLLPNQQGRAAEILGVTRDITERVQAAARLMQAQKMESIGRLAGGVAHDFNNLLTVINGYSRLLLGKLNAGDPLRDSLEEIHRAGERAAALTQQLLAFSRQQVLKPCVLDLNRVVGGMRPMLERLVGEDVELCVELHAEATICADPHQLEQVVMNLAVNSRDAMPHGGNLSIETAVVEWGAPHAQSHPGARPGPYVMLAVSDSGVGMNEETRRHIFEPFFTTKEAGKGTGLGLSMIQGIVEQSGGYIEVYSEPGSGTTFRIYLPRVEAAPANAGKPEAVSVPANGGKETVLVVEDLAEVRKYAAAALSAYGYRVIQAESASEALQLCEREGGRLDLVLTDVVMPNLSGRELANRLGKRWPGIKVLFMSGYTDDAIIHHGVLEKSAEFIQKPFNPDQLAVKVREMLVARDRPARILVADDDAGVRSFLRMVLEDGGYEVIEAANGKQALKEARAGQVNLVITDLVMPEQEGIETIQALRKDGAGIGIIAMSGAFGGQFLKLSRKLGADEVLSKPVGAGLLLAKVAEVLKLRR